MAGPLCGPILRAHLDGPLRLPDLRERIGGAAQTTLRGQVGNLRAIGALERHVRSGMPYTVENELTDVGYGILGVAKAVEAWLAQAPQGSISFGSEPAKGAIRSLVAGWDSTVLRALAARPLSLTELSGVIPEFSYPSLERRLSAMRASHQIEMLQNESGNARPYAVTDWTRQAVGPLIAAGRCECNHIAESANPLTRVDIEAAFLLAIPLVALPVDSSGSCQLAVNVAEDEEPTAEGEDPEESIQQAAGVQEEELEPEESIQQAVGVQEEEPEAIQQAAGVRVDLERGEIVSCVSELEENPGTWVLGAVDAWVEAIIEGRSEGLDVGGRDQDLARSLIEGLHRSISAPG